jgi:RNA polymerase sigma factor (sigma-70 family)
MEDSMSRSIPGEGPPDALPPRTLITVELLQRAKDGDAAALERIMERYLPRLQRWARGRLPDRTRSVLDTSDLVQETLTRTLQGLERIEVRGKGGFEAYVRQSVLNQIRDQIRRAAIRQTEIVSPDLVTPEPSPLEDAIGADLFARFEHGMASLEPEDRRLVHLRVELEFDYDEIAAMTGRPSRDAARMAFQRALKRLAQAMKHDE